VICVGGPGGSAAGGSCILGIDPGSVKAGYALIDESGAVVAAGIEPLQELPARLRELAAGHRIAAVALGRGTNALATKVKLEELGLPIHFVDEYETTRRARELYFVDHPPRGWRRLIPLGMQLPERPIDDYAAILIARRFLTRGVEAESPI
jgi:RNase H-fold protein (predicted Holliday junction resolvase)